MELKSKHSIATAITARYIIIFRKIVPASDTEKCIEGIEKNVSTTKDTETKITGNILRELFTKLIRNSPIIVNIAIMKSPIDKNDNGLAY